MAEKMNRKIIIIPQEEFILKIAEVDKSKCYYDIGAGPGLDVWLTMNLLQKGNIDIIAFEPSREGYLSYQKLFGQYKKVKLFNIGLGNKAEVRNLKIIPSRYHWATFLNNRLDKLIKNKHLPFIKDNVIITDQRARIELLDSFANKKSLPIPDIIKIDAEGWEYKVVLGAQKLIKKNLPVLFIEFHHESNKNFKNMQILLHKLGYNHLTIFHLNSSYNGIFPYHIFYHLKEKEKIIKIFNELLETDLRKFYIKSFIAMNFQELILESSIKSIKDYGFE